MQNLVTSDEMKKIEEYTINTLGIPAIVLMERAALACENCIEQYMSEHPDKPKTVIIMCGPGNNGADGLALSRLLSENGFRVDVWFPNDSAQKSELCSKQKKILEHYEVHFCSNPLREDYTIAVDALFGIGLSRELTGNYAKAVEDFNLLHGYKIAIDVPSGLDTDTGKIWGTVVKVQETVTFGFAKRGLYLYPGCEFAGKICIADIGISEMAMAEITPEMYMLNENIEELLPKRSSAGNKGTFGKLLLVAGSVNMAGASILAARAAYRIGTGMVKVITAEENRNIIQSAIPEALFDTYDGVQKSFAWADVIAIGPGLGTSEEAKQVLTIVLKESKQPLLLDADALNMIASDVILYELVAKNAKEGRDIVITPHMGEFSRLTNIKITDLKNNVLEYVKDYAKTVDITVMAKDARTYIYKNGESICLNCTGNSGMATAGSGDVLAGTVAGLMAQGMDGYHAACTGAYIHGRVGERVAGEIGEYACMAGDLATY